MASRFGQKTAKQWIEEVAANDASLQVLDLTKSASFCMKAEENTRLLCEALKTNTSITKLILRECELNDAGMEALAEALKVNHVIEEIDLSKNHISTAGGMCLAAGLAENRGVKTLSLMDQSQKLFGEGALEAFIAMFQTNQTLTKLMWKVDSRRAWELSKMFTRNVEIQRKGGQTAAPPAAAAPAAAPKKEEPAATVAEEPVKGPPLEAAPEMAIAA